MDNKKNHSLLRRVIAPVLTPFQKDRSLDFETLAKFTDWLCDQDLHALFPMGGSGEFQTLNLPERKAIIDCMIPVINHRKVFFVGTGGSSLSETIELSQYAQTKGADGVGVVIPEFIRPGEDSVFDYFREIDCSVTIPIMVYDPYGEGQYSATPKLLRRMIDNLQNIAGIKYRAVNAEYMGNMAYEIAGDISLLSGNEATYLQDLSIGAVGCVGGGGCFYPGLMNKLQDHFERGEVMEARQIQFKIFEALHILNRVYWPLSGKIVLQELGIPFQLVTRIQGRPFKVEDVRMIRTYYRSLLKG